MRTSLTRIFAAWVLVTLALFSVRPVQATDTVLVPAGAVWKYRDNGSNQGTAWRAPVFDDSAWKSGPAQLGYGDGDESTVLSYGPDANNKYITSYFRRAFNVANPAALVSLTLGLLRDDGAVVYLNGVEVFRSNMPSGTISYTTLASAAIGGGDESTYVTTALSPNVLVAGTNVIAVEIHQANGTSSDLSFNLDLVASDSATVTRGPYLQLATPTSMVVRWRTNTATGSRVWYGAAPGSLTGVADTSGTGTEHVVSLTGLLPSTRYYYAVGSVAGPLAGGDAAHSFVTPPVAGTAQPTRIWVIGDAGTASVNQVAVRDAYLNYTGNRATDLWLMLGDNSYPNSTDAEYQAGIFDIYPMVLSQSPFWPSYGNHDANSSDSPTQTGPYYVMLSLPTQGEAGGMPSGTEAYYSFDYGNIHFIALDSSESNRSPSGPMLTWLRSDLAANTKDWTIAFWHHAPYSKGGQNSDTDTGMREMRENALPILEAGGVDLVLGGHSHSYERSFLLDGHYAASTTFTAAMKKDGGNGREDGSGAYWKPSLGPAPHEGTVYAVAGSSGQISGGSLNHPAMFTSLNVLGSMVIDVDGSRLDAKFIDNTATVRDYFTMVKGSASGPTAPTALTAAASSGRIDLLWSDNATNEDGFQVERSVSGGSFALHGTAGPDATTYADTSVQPSTSYSYRVRAFNGSGFSGWSNVASATTPAPPDTTAPVRSNGAPSATLGAGTTQTTLSLATNENATCRYETSAGVAYGSMSNVFTTTGGTAHSTTVSGLTNGASYSYFVRCQDDIGNPNLDDFMISFSVAQPVTSVTAFPTGTTILTGTLNSGSAASLTSDNNVYFAVNSTTSGTRTTSWYGSFTGVTSALTNLRVNYKGNNSASCTQTIAIWRWTDSTWVQLNSRSVSTTEIAINNLTPSGTLANYVSTTGSSELRVRVRCTRTGNFTARGDLMSIVYNAPIGPPPPDTTAPVRSNGVPSGTLAAGTTQTTISLATNENAICRYATSAGVTYDSMSYTFTTTGGTAHSTTVSGLTSGGSNSYFVRCQDTSVNANANLDDFTISFSVASTDSTSYKASVDFSSTQGFRNWYYLYGSGTQMTFVGGEWQGNETYLVLWADGGHPGNSSDAIRRWKAPQAGSVNITGKAIDDDTSCGSGVSVNIKKNSTILWQQAIANGNTAGVSFNVTTTVAAGDNIDFGINRGGTDNYCDSTAFAPTILFTP